MASTWSCAFVTLTMAFAVTLNQADKSDLHSQWLQHVTSNKAYACRDPLPKAVATATLAAESSEGDGVGDEALIWQPGCTILHRCEGSGCCAGAPRRSCAPSDGEYVNLVFYVKNALEPRKPAFFRELSAFNHTACACRDSADLPKR